MYVCVYAYIFYPCNMFCNIIKKKNLRQIKFNRPWAGKEKDSQSSTPDKKQFTTCW